MISQTWLQQTRFTLQSVQGIQKAIVKLMIHKQEKSCKDPVIVDHKIKNLITILKQKAEQGLKLLNDQDNIKMQQMSILAGQKTITPNYNKPPDVWHNFYQKVKSVRQFHKKFIAKVVPTNSPQFYLKCCFQPPFSEPQFSLQEAKGKYIDLNVYYLQYINLNPKKKIKHDYLWYLNNFDVFQQADKSKFNKYLNYLKNLQNYLKDYFKRVQPITNHENVFDLIKEEFQNFNKSELQNQKNKQKILCKPCGMQFVNKNSFVNHLAGKKHKKKQKNYSKLIENNNQQQQIEIKKNNKQKEAAQLQFNIKKFKQILGNKVFETMNLVRKKQTKDYQEIQQQPQEQQSDSSQQQPIYNPKNLPLGWDGKPIPYWLYKLHGLGVQYKCQICGNYSYWGRKAFQRHFQQWRHAYGMKCLQIPNTIHFKDVTTISDAIALHSKLMAQSQLSRFRPQVQQQFEDEQGNILNRKMYQDLKKQGLL